MNRLSGTAGSDAFAGAAFRRAFFPLGILMKLPEPTDVFRIMTKPSGPTCLILAVASAAICLL